MSIYTILQLCHVICLLKKYVWWLFSVCLQTMCVCVCVAGGKRGGWWNAYLDLFSVCDKQTYSFHPKQWLLSIILLGWWRGINSSDRKICELCMCVCPGMYEKLCQWHDNRRKLGNLIHSGETAKQPVSLHYISQMWEREAEKINLAWDRQQCLYITLW